MTTSQSDHSNANFTHIGISQHNRIISEPDPTINWCIKEESLIREQGIETVYTQVIVIYDG